MFKLISFIITLIILQGCQTQNITPKTNNNNIPKWLLNPYVDGDSIAAIGCSQIHFNGIAAQKDLAISRAIDRIAAQNRVIIENVTYRETYLQGNNKNSNLKSSSLHTIDKVKISTKIKEIYTKQDGEICAWVVQK